MITKHIKIELIGQIVRADGTVEPEFVHDELVYIPEEDTWRPLLSTPDEQ